MRHDGLVDNLRVDSQRWQGSACLHAGIDPVQPRTVHHHGRLRRHQYQHRNRGAKHPWLDPGHRCQSPATSCETPELDYSATPYGHNFFVDATPGTGDLFYNGVWHTWLVGRSGSGRSGDLCARHHQPLRILRERSAPQNIVIGEWNSATITCARPDHRLRHASGQHLRHAANSAPAQRQLGGHLRQWLRQRFRRCRHLRHGDHQLGNTDVWKHDVLLPEHQSVGQQPATQFSAARVRNRPGW